MRLTCGVLGFSTQAFYKWRADRCSDRDLDDAHLTNAIVDVHADDPEFGYRFIADELEAAGHRAWRTAGVAAVLASSGSGRRPRSKGRKARGKTPGPAVHDDLVQRSFTAPAPDAVWLTDITEHPTVEGKLYCLLDQGRVLEPDRRLRDRRSHDRQARRRRVALRDRSPPTGTAPSWSTPTAAANFDPEPSGPRSTAAGLTARWAESPRPATTPRWNRSTRCCRRTCSTADAGATRDELAYEIVVLDRTHLQPSPPTTRPRQAHPRRVRTRLHPDHRRRSMITHNHRQPNLQQTQASIEQ